MTRPPMTRERVAQLCEELSLIDIAQLALAKMAGPEGLDPSNAGLLEAASLTHRVTMRVLSKKTQAEMRRLDEEARARREARRAAAKADAETKRSSEETP